MAATQPVYDVNVLTQPAGGGNVTVVGPVDGSGNIKVAQQGAVQLAAGTALVGQVEQSDGTNVIGTATHPTRVDPTGTTTQPVSLAAGSNLAGQVEISDGTNVLGTSTHPVRTDPTGTTTQPVSGTFWQATQPVSGNVGLLAGSALVGQVEQSDGTNVIGTATHPTRVDPTGTTTQPVSGTFWQATQPVSLTPPSAVVSGQTTIATGGTAVQLASHALTAGIVAIRALPGNAGTVYVGPSGVSSTTGVPLKADDTMLAYVANTNALYVNGAGVGDGIGYLAS